MVASAARLLAEPGCETNVKMTKGELENELERLHPESFGWALACCNRKPADAEDLLQSVHLKVLDGSARFSGKSSFRTWLFGVIRRTAIQQRRKWAVREQLLRLMFFKQSPEESNSPEASAAYSHSSRRLVQALNHLSRRQREVVQLVFYHDLTIEKAAQVLGLSTGSARTHYARGKSRLARQIEEMNDG